MLGWCIEMNQIGSHEEILRITGHSISWPCYEGHSRESSCVLEGQHQYYPYEDSE